MKLRSVHGVADVCHFGDGPPRLLLEVAHGATEREDYDRVARRLRSALPAELDHFFHVNTDVGAWELAVEIAASLPFPSIAVRCRIPRTFVDCNRVLGATGMTAGIPPFVDDPADQAMLRGLHEAWRAVVDPLWAAEPETALAVHTYAPREVGIAAVDAQIVENLHRCWAEPEAWPLRPEIDLITEDPDGRLLAPGALAQRAASNWRAAGFQVAWNGSYTLHPAALVSQRAMARPGAVLCFEVRRDLLMRRWDPFSVMEADPARVAAVAAPMVAALLSGDARPRADG